MQLRKAESLRMLDQHHSRIGDIDPHFDYRRRDQHVDLSVTERAHDLLAFVSRHPAVDQRDNSTRKWAS